MFYVVNFPNGDEFYACKACANLVFSHDAGAYGFPAEDDNHSCELHYENVCEDKPSTHYTDIHIEEFELGVRSYNILKRMGIDFSGDLIHVTPFDLQHFYDRRIEEGYGETPVTGRALRDIVETQAEIRSLRPVTVVELYNEGN